MDPEEKELLKKTAETTEENNRLLRRMVLFHRIGFWWSFLKWAIIIGSALGLYYYFGDTVSNLFDQFNSLLNNF